MKLNRITAENVLGLHHVALDITTPITLIAGPNGAGKSSLQNAIRMAATGQLSRVSLKKDAEALVRDGAKKGLVTVTTDDGKSCSYSLPKGLWEESYGPEVNIPRLSALLDPPTFARMKDDERRTFLFDLAGLQINAGEVRARLERRGCDMSKVEAILPMLRTGFPGAEKAAKERATEAKGAWKAITGETYGSQKAEDWAAEKPAGFDLGALADKRDALKAVDKQLAAANQELGAIKAMQQAAEDHDGTIAELRVKAARVAELTKQVERYQAEVAAEQARVDAQREKAGQTPAQEPQPCPHCAGALIVKAGAILPYQGAAKYDKAAAAELPAMESSLGVIERTLANRQEELSEALAADATIEQMEKVAPKAPDQGELNRIGARVEAMQGSRELLQIDIADLESRARAITDAEANTAKAAEHHADVLAWLKLAEAFAPDGIPGELLAEALEPMNRLLAQHAQATGWKLTQIGADMAITASGRPYALLSESEQWRVDAMIGAALAELSGYRLLMLDRFDVLDIPGRGQLLNWLMDLAEAGTLETALLFGTLKSCPKGNELLGTHWIDGGQIVVERVEKAA